MDITPERFAGHIHPRSARWSVRMFLGVGFIEPFAGRLPELFTGGVAHSDRRRPAMTVRTFDWDAPCAVQCARYPRF